MDGDPDLVGVRAVSSTQTPRERLGLCTRSRQRASGSSNTALGYRAGCSPGMEITSGTRNTYLGALSGPLFGVETTNATAVGADVVLTQSNSVILGNNASVGIGTATPKAKVEVAGGASW